MSSVVEQLFTAFQKASSPFDEKPDAVVKQLEQRWSSSELVEGAQDYLRGLVGQGWQAPSILSGDTYLKGSYCLVLLRCFPASRTEEELVRRMIVALPPPDWYVQIGEFLHTRGCYATAFQGVASGLGTGCRHLEQQSLQALCYYSFPTDYAFSESDSQVMKTTYAEIRQALERLRMSADPITAALAADGAKGLALNFS
jgi:hypothetical protein